MSAPLPAQLYQPTLRLALVAVALTVFISSPSLADAAIPDPSSGSGDHGGLLITTIQKEDEQEGNGVKSSGDDDDGGGSGSGGVSSSSASTTTTTATTIPTTAAAITIGVQSGTPLAEMNPLQQEELIKTVATFVVATTDISHGDIAAIQLEDTGTSSKRPSRSAAGTVIAVTLILKPTLPVAVAEQAAVAFVQAINTGTVSFLKGTGWEFTGSVSTASVSATLNTLNAADNTTTPAVSTVSTMTIPSTQAAKNGNQPSSSWKGRRTAVIVGTVLLLIPVALLFVLQRMRCREGLSSAAAEPEQPRKCAADTAPTLAPDEKNPPGNLHECASPPSSSPLKPTAARRSTLFVYDPRRARTLTLESPPSIKVSIV